MNIFLLKIRKNVGNKMKELILCTLMFDLIFFVSEKKN